MHCQHRHKVIMGMETYTLVSAKRSWLTKVLRCYVCGEFLEPIYSSTFQPEYKNGHIYKGLTLPLSIYQHRGNVLDEKSHGPHRAVEETTWA